MYIKYTYRPLWWVLLIRLKDMHRWGGVNEKTLYLPLSYVVNIKLL